MMRLCIPFPPSLVAGEALVLSTGILALMIHGSRTRFCPAPPGVFVPSSNLMMRSPCDGHLVSHPPLLREQVGVAEEQGEPPAKIL